MAAPGRSNSGLAGLLAGRYVTPQLLTLLKIPPPQLYNTLHSNIEKGRGDGADIKKTSDVICTTLCAHCGCIVL